MRKAFCINILVTHMQISTTAAGALLRGSCELKGLVAQALGFEVSGIGFWGLRVWSLEGLVVQGFMVPNSKLMMFGQKGCNSRIQGLGVSLEAEHPRVLTSAFRI